MTHPPFCLWGTECHYPAKVRSDWAATISVASLKSFLQVPLYSRYNVTSASRTHQAERLQLAFWEKDSWSVNLWLKITSVNIDALSVERKVSPSVTICVLSVKLITLHHTFHMYLITAVRPLALNRSKHPTCQQEIFKYRLHWSHVQIFLFNTWKALGWWAVFNPYIFC